jgi:hypothetical protein
MTFIAHYDLELHQMDVKTTFLNGDLEEEVYMDQLEGFSFKSYGNHHPETLVIIWEQFNGQIKSYNPFESLLWFGTTRPALHRVVIPYLLKEKRPSKTPVKN